MFHNTPELMLHYIQMLEHIGRIGYTSIRFILKTLIFVGQFILGKPRDLETVVSCGHNLINAGTALQLPWFTHTRHIPKSHAVEVYDLQFASPVTLAAYESNLTALNWYMKLGLGGLCYKTMMAKPRTGNKRPRLQEVCVNGEPALINAMGLPGPGATAAIQAILASPLCSYNRPIGLSIGGETVADYHDTFQAYNQHIQHHDHPFYYEINISCPNTDEGKQLSETLDELETLVATIRTFTQRVISIKLSPDQDNAMIVKTAQSCILYDKIILNVGNTQYKQCTQVGLPVHAIKRGGGGLSGKPLKARTLECVSLLAALRVPIIATGGISTVEDIKQAQQAGATLVGVATQVALNPFFISTTM
ncbi:hypothetical protein OAJ27_02040 [bacterium]|nr:hypothetical protein [bacterium]